VGLIPTDKGLSIFRITERSAAFDAGLAVNDVVLKVNGSGISSVEEFIRTVSGYKPSDKISIRIRRGEEEKDVDAVLRRRGEFPEAIRTFEDPRNSISGALSAQRSGFPAALQHDLFLKPSQCGGPLTNLDGEVVGVNIAHSGRTESLALNGATLVTVLQTVDQGKFYHPELDELTKAKANLEAEVKRVGELEARLKKEIDELGKKLEAITGK
jgi:serine protease Do